MLKFTSAQAVPVLSLLGTSQTVIKLVESLLAPAARCRREHIELPD